MGKFGKMDLYIQDNDDWLFALAVYELWDAVSNVISPIQELFRRDVEFHIPISINGLSSLKHVLFWVSVLHENW